MKIEQNLESFPTLPLDGLRYAIDSLASTVPSAGNLKPEGLVDLTILGDAKTAP